MSSNFSIKGLSLGGNTSLTYLYGLSDFWVDMFEDSVKINEVLEVTSFSLSDVYSKFLQLCSNLTLADVQVAADSQIKLVLINENDLIPGEGYTYKIDTTILEAKFIANRPLLPTSLLEENIHFRITPGKIQFFDHIANFGFPVRPSKTGKEYALWLTDVKIDYQWVSDNYAKFVNLSPQPSSENYKDLVSGMFFLFSHGPILKYMQRGLNLLIGVPVSRVRERVLSIIKLEDSELWTVICETNSYLIPYGLSPTVTEGEMLDIGRSMSDWVEIKDYESDGDWWINLYIPEKLITVLPDTVPNRFATRGSYADQMMRKYLKNHTFLCRVNVAGFKSIQTFEHIYTILMQAKPTYTFPIYVWAVPNTEVLGLDFETKTQIDFRKCESITIDSSRFNRKDQGFTRGCPRFIRMNAPGWVDNWMGRNPYINGVPRYINSGFVYGYRCQELYARNPLPEEGAWAHTLNRRNNAKALVSRGFISPTRAWDREMVNVPSEGLVETLTAGQNLERGASDPASYAWTKEYFNGDLNFEWIPGTPVEVQYMKSSLDDGSNLELINVPMINEGNVYQPQVVLDHKLYRLVPLYITNRRDLRRKLEAVGHKDTGTDIPPKFIVFNSSFVNNYDIWIARDPSVGYLGAFIPEQGYQTFRVKKEDLYDTDHIFYTQIHDDIYAVYIYTRNSHFVPQYVSVAGPDTMSYSGNIPMSRSGHRFDTPLYLTRSTAQPVYDIHDDVAFNEEVIGTGSTVEFTSLYSDRVNVNVKLSRGGASLTHFKKVD